MFEYNLEVSATRRRISGPDLPTPGFVGMFPVFFMGAIPPSESDSVYYLCQRCANCCRWPGEVPVSDAEIQKIADFLDLPVADFIERHTKLRLNRTGLTLLDRPDGSCEFLEGNACSINPVKPSQCRGFPNRWNFPGWEALCEAIPIFSQGPAAESESQP